ncbi:MAG TPA: 30S ribosomal protein S14 [Candidatus Nanoarchaeia archaeon]|nr:30S ribosomal protein S14 [Candidatus Nanoarchaeia archaeon]
MTYSEYSKTYKQLKNKKAKWKKFVKHNAPKVRKYGKSARRCSVCGRIGGYVRKYDLNQCRQCFRENARTLGFKKYK